MAVIGSQQSVKRPYLKQEKLKKKINLQKQTHEKEVKNNPDLHGKKKKWVVLVVFLIHATLTLFSLLLISLFLSFFFRGKSRLRKREASKILIFFVLIIFFLIMMIVYTFLAENYIN